MVLILLPVVSAFIGNCLGANALSCFHDVPGHGPINPSTATAIAMLTCVAASDIATSVLLCVFLWRRRTGFATNDRLIRLLILYSVEVGMLTSLASVGSLSTFIAVGYDSAIFVSIFWVVPKLSINSLLALLNARHHLREEAGLVSTSIAHDPSVPASDSLRFEVSRSQIWRRSRRTQLFVTVETEIELDRGSDTSRRGGSLIEMLPVTLARQDGADFVEDKSSGHVKGARTYLARDVEANIRVSRM
ncbi:uncharacterized protein B0H18DRAFT_1121658 [Fomitopsis serialis]|uniref:uncharacterized protein n=1 Tax=Fomitopsis serialis TaxID=139415 RepID=UPI002008EB67|nr:uncharacterized protein B0H18DRAFT_1121658 [Neoantrodia serialis]KAH9920933.1 hypothetical protein B0H18DRAFT_1121658 [Neoantrodia serialis]